MATSPDAHHITGQASLVQDVNITLIEMCPTLTYSCPNSLPQLGTKLELGHLFQRLEVRAPYYLGA